MGAATSRTSSDRTHQREDGLYQELLARQPKDRDEDGDHRHHCLHIARDQGLPRRHVEAAVHRAAARESWRIAGMQLPRPGAITWTYGKGGRWRADTYDAEGIAHPLSAEEVRALVYLLIDERRGLEIPADVRAAAMRPFDRTPAKVMDDTGAPERTEKWTASEALIAPQANESGIRRCAICHRPIPTEKRSDSETCSKKHTRLLHRLRKGDPTVHDAIRMATNPPPCLGCGKPLFDMRAGTKVHNDRCRAKAKRRGTKAPYPGVDVGEDTGAPIRTEQWTAAEGVAA